MDKIIDNPEICITGLGMITSVGHDVKTACASIRANIRRPKKLDNFYVPSTQAYDDYEDGLVTTHPVLPGNPDDTETRILSLLDSAMEDLYNNTDTDKDIIDNAPIYLSVCEEDRNKTDQQIFKDHLAPRKVTIFNHGNAGVITALVRAVEDKNQYAIIAGTDSLINYDDLVKFNQAKQLRTELNPEGFSPGEAASVILIEKISTAKNIKAVIDKIVINNTLENVISKMAQDKENTIEPDSIISDMNGEPSRSEETGKLHTAILNKIKGEKNIIWPARHIGDTAAAYAGVAMCMLVRAMARCYISETKKSGNGLVLASSDKIKGGVYITPYQE